MKKFHTIILSLTLLFLLSAAQTATAQQPIASHTVVKSVTYKNTPIEIPDHLSKKEKAERFARIIGNRLALSETQVMRLTIKRMQYLNKVEELGGTNDGLDAVFHANFRALLTPAQYATWEEKYQSPEE